MFARAGIPEDVYLKYEHEPKFKISRLLIGDLEQIGEEGYLLQRRLVTELCKLRNLPDKDVLDRDAGLEALRRLKRAAQEHDLDLKEEQANRAPRVADAAETTQKARDRDRRLKELHQAFVELSQSLNVQRRGYDLEDLLKELFALYEIALQAKIEKAAQEGIIYFPLIRLFG
jgi:hypothetical protein